MRLKSKVASLVILCGVFFTALSFAVQPSIPDRPLNHVVDLANIIDANIEA